MQRIIFIILALSYSCIQPNNPETKAEDKTSAYDSTRAAKAGADPYGMRTYVMAFLKKGPNRPTDSIEAVRLQSAHMANINRLAEEGKLLLAGPFYGTDSLRGIYIFDTDNLEEAKKFTETDPAIQQGSLKMDLRLWYGSAALMEVNEIHKILAKKEI